MGAIIGAIFIFLEGLFEKLSFYNVNKISYKNFLMFLIFMNSFVGIFLVHVISGYEIFFDFLRDPLFYLILILEVSAIALYKKKLGNTL